MMTSSVITWFCEYQDCKQHKAVSRVNGLCERVSVMLLQAVLLMVAIQAWHCPLNIHMWRETVVEGWRGGVF